MPSWRLVAAAVAPARCGAVLKANAYGLGAPAVVRALLQAGCREFFVALVHEGAELMEALRDGGDHRSVNIGWMGCSV